jgi:hypothetical protein
VRCGIGTTVAGAASRAPRREPVGFAMPSPDPQILRRSLPLVGHFLIAHLGTLIECDPKQVETRHLGISSNWFFAAFSAALVISAVLGPRVGRQIDLVGGRQVLSAPNLILAAGLALRTFRAAAFTVD